MSNIPKYQKDYSSHCPKILDTDVRLEKAGKMLCVLEDAGVLASNTEVALDIGCSGGYFIRALSDYYDSVLGLDIDVNALLLAREEGIAENISVIAADSMNMPLPDNSVDLVVCNHVYEHVPSSEKLFSEIYRVLKVNGVCYFGAASRLVPIEPHYNLPLLSWFPKNIANVYMKLARKGDYYYENLRTYWGLKKLISQFEIKDYTLEIVAFPDKYNARDLIKKGSLLDKIPMIAWKLFYRVLPGYIFLLVKRSSQPQ